MRRPFALDLKNKTKNNSDQSEECISHSVLQKFKCNNFSFSFLIQTPHSLPLIILRNESVFIFSKLMWFLWFFYAYLLCILPNLKYGNCYVHIFSKCHGDYKMKAVECKILLKFIDGSEKAYDFIFDVQISIFLI